MMVTIEEYKQLALSKPGVSEQVHFDRLSYRTKKRIFTTLLEPANTANVKLSREDQLLYSAIDRKAIFPVDNKWGAQGWTTVRLDLIDESLLTEMIDAAYRLGIE